jgi:hypothetical protein
MQTSSSSGLYTNVIPRRFSPTTLPQGWDFSLFCLWPHAVSTAEPGQLGVLNNYWLNWMDLWLETHVGTAVLLLARALMISWEEHSVFFPLSGQSSAGLACGRHSGLPWAWGFPVFPDPHHWLLGVHLGPANSPRAG